VQLQVFDIGLIEPRASRKWWHATSTPADTRKTAIVSRLNFGGDGASPRRRGDVETTPGRCNNLDYCSIGMQRVLVEVALSKPFVCPECGGKLRSPVKTGMRRPWVMPVLRLAILLAGIGLGIVQGYVIGRMQPTVKRAVASVSHDTVEKVNAARALLGLPKLPPEAIRAAPDSAPPPAQMPQAAKPAAAPLLVAERPYPHKSPPIDSADPPAHLSDEQHFGLVVVDCTLGAIEVKPACHATDTRGGDAFSAAAVAWLNGLSVQYAPGRRNGAPALLDHRWRVVFDDFAGAPPHARPQSTPRR
jgi:hypothetical protein